MFNRILKYLGVERVEPKKSVVDPSASMASLLQKTAAVPVARNERRDGNNYVSDAAPGAQKYTTIGLRYEDVDGNYTERVVSIAKLSVAEHDWEHTMLIAFCHYKNDIRHFRADRIKGFFDPETGELMDTATLHADPSVFRLAAGGDDDDE